jgi:site-specific recombinase XerD
MLDLEKLFEEFLRERRYLKNISPNTEKFYRQSWTAYKKYSSLELELSKGQLNNWVITMREAGVTPKSCNTFISAINAYVHWLYDSELIPRRIGATLIKLPDPTPTAVSEKTVQRLSNFKPQSKGQFRTHTVLSLLIDTGMRIDEALSAKLKDVDLDQSLITITGKGGRKRTIPISFEMRKRLYVWIKKRGDNPCPFLFPTSTYNRMEYHNYRRDLHVILKKLEIEERIHPHAFRHYFAITFLRKGGDLFRLSKILGHANLSVTEIYLSSMPTVAISEAHRQFSPLVQN